MNLNWNFQLGEGGGCKTKTLLWGEYLMVIFCNCTMVSHLNLLFGCYRYFAFNVDFAQELFRNVAGGHVHNSGRKSPAPGP